MPKSKWPACLDALTPPNNKLGTKPPADIAAAFKQAGWPVKTPLPVRVVALLGRCSTLAYRDCPTTPQWHLENAESEGDDFLEEIGGFHWCDFDVTDAEGKTTPLRVAFNSGDADCNDGTWGLVWDRETAKVVAELTSVGDCEGQVKVTSKAFLKAFAPHGREIPTGSDLFPQSGLPCSMAYANDAEVEKLIVVAMRWCYGS
jgi:hypothetical protein